MSLKDKFSKIVNELTKPLTPAEKKLKKAIESEENLIEPFLIDKDPFSINDDLKLAKKNKCKHEFIVVDFEKGLLKCKHCGMEITALELGRKIGTVLAKKKSGVDIDDILSI